MGKQRNPQKLVNVCVALCLQLLISAFLLAACGTGSTGKITSSSPVPASTVKSTSTVTTPPHLPRDSGHEVLYLTNKTGSIANTGGDFYASHPYIIFILCTGSGNISIDYSPQGKVTFNCLQPGQIQAQAMGNDQHPPTSENVHVQVTVNERAIWEVSVQLQP